MDRSTHFRHSRLVALAAAAAVAIAGCAQIAGTPTTTDTPQQAGTSQPDSDSDATDPTNNDPNAPTADPAPTGGPMRSITDPVKGGADLTAAVGDFGGPLAVVMAESTSTLDVVDGHTITIRTELPVGAEMTTTIHLFANATQSPGDPPVITGDMDDTTLSYTMTYALDPATLPADLLAQIDNGLPDDPPDGIAPGLRARGTGAVTRDRGQGKAIGAAIDGEISQIKEFAVDKGLEAAAEHSGGAAVPGSAAWEIYKAGKKVWDAGQLKGIMDDAMKELDRLKRCAANPSSEVTKKHYQDNPGEQKSLIDEIEDTRSSIRGSMAAIFAGMLEDAASGLVKAAPWLGFIISPAVSYVKETNLELIKNALHDIRSKVPGCHRYSVKTASGKLSVTGVIEDLGKSFSLSGAFPGGSITLNYSGGQGGGAVTYTGSGGGATMTGSGSYSLREPPEGDGVVFLTQTTNGCADIGTCKENTEVLLLTPMD